jgi:hypothetical protein
MLAGTGCVSVAYPMMRGKCHDEQVHEQRPT